MQIFALILVFVAGITVGALVVYKMEERAFTTMINQGIELEKATKEAREECEEYRKTRAMMSIIDDVPDYLVDKYDISIGAPVSQTVEIDEDYEAIYN